MAERKNYPLIGVNPKPPALRVDSLLEGRPPKGISIIPYSTVHPSA